MILLRRYDRPAYSDYPQAITFIVIERPIDMVVAKEESRTVLAMIAEGVKR